MTITQQYLQLRRKALNVLNDVNGDGWRLARYTYDAVQSLMRSEKITQQQALKAWSDDLSNKGQRFSPTSARRYFEVWNKYGATRQHKPDGSEYSFSEHYAIVRGGQNALKAMDEAVARGSGAQSAAQNLVVFDGKAVSGAMRRVAEVARALDKLSDYPLTQEELDGLSQLEKRMARNLSKVRKLAREKE